MCVCVFVFVSVLDCVRTGLHFFQIYLYYVWIGTYRPIEIHTYIHWSTTRWTDRCCMTRAVVLCCSLLSFICLQQYPYVLEILFCSFVRFCTASIYNTQYLLSKRFVSLMSECTSVISSFCIVWLSILISKKIKSSVRTACWFPTNECTFHIYNSRATSTKHKDSSRFSFPRYPIFSREVLRSMKT